MLSKLIALSMISMSAFNPFASQDKVLAHHAFSLNDRYSKTYVNKVFKDNILLTLHYMDGSVKDKKMHEDMLQKPLSYSFTLQPNETFAFHDSVLPQYKETLAKTTNAHFGASEGFISDGDLVGDGVCHFASLINWTAKDAGLDVNAPTNHNFAVIPDIPKEYGVAIYDQENNASASAQQNLYVTNNKAYPIKLTFDYKDNTLTTKVEQE